MKYIGKNEISLLSIIKENKNLISTQDQKFEDMNFRCCLYQVNE